MPFRNMEFIDSIDILTERKMKAMSERSKSPVRTVKQDAAIKIKKEKGLGRMSKDLLHRRTLSITLICYKDRI